MKRTLFCILMATTLPTSVSAQENYSEEDLRLALVIDELYIGDKMPLLPEKWGRNYSFVEDSQGERTFLERQYDFNGDDRDDYSAVFLICDGSIPDRPFSLQILYGKSRPTLADRNGDEVIDYSNTYPNPRLATSELAPPCVKGAK